MIASVAFRNFKALRNTSLALAPFNLLIGPNGSGKTSLIESLQQLRTLARLPLRGSVPDDERLPEGAEITVRFSPPFDGLEATMRCASESACDLLEVAPLPTGEGVNDWPVLRAKLITLRSYVFDERAIAEPALASATELAPDGAGLAAVLVLRRDNAPEAFAAFTAELFRILPEYDGVVLSPRVDGRIALALRLAGTTDVVPAHRLSQGTLYLLAVLTVALDPHPPSVVCIEEVDRGIHPRLLRDVRDLLYRLSFPEASGTARAPVQVIATTHSPYLIDLFRDHPEEVVIAEKHGNVATLSRLGDHANIAELLAEGSLGDLWFSGILGGVPEGR